MFASVGEPRVIFKKSFFVLAFVVSSNKQLIVF